MNSKSLSLALACSILAGAVHAQSTHRASVDSNGAQASGHTILCSISADGRYVAFSSQAPNLVAGDTNGTNDVFVHDSTTGQTTRVSVDSVGAQGNSGSSFDSNRVISADGRYVAFESSANNLVPGDTNLQVDIFVHDRATGLTKRVSVDSSGNQGNGISTQASISPDGRYVVFTSDASNLVPGDTNAHSDVFVHDRLTGQTVRASVGTGGVQGNQTSEAASISADGRYVAFESFASNLVPSDTNGSRDVFVRDLSMDLTTRVSVTSAGLQGNGASEQTSISDDGRYVAFSSLATNLVPGDTNGASDVFVHDRSTGSTTRVSIDSAGVQGGSSSGDPSISADGRYLTFDSWASDLVPGDTNAYEDVFVHDQLTGGTTRASVDSFGAQGDQYSITPAISADGRYVVFISASTNLVSGDTNGFADAFVRDRLGAQPIVAFCAGDGVGTACPCGNSGSAWHGCANSQVVDGALLTAAGATQPDTIMLTSTGELSNVLSIFLQGDADLNPGVHFGDGVRCVGGSLKRLYVKHASAGTVSAPGPGDLSIAAQSASLGDTIAPGSSRGYQVYYRDSNLNFCPAPAGDSWNVSNATRILW